MFEKTFIPFVKSQVFKAGHHHLSSKSSEDITSSKRSLTNKNSSDSNKNCDDDATEVSPLFVMKDPIDECMKDYFSRLKQDIQSKPELFGLDFEEFPCSSFSSSPPATSRESMMMTLKKDESRVSLDCFFDFDMNAFRRPSILMQTAGHVSSAAFYYRGDEIEKQLRSHQASDQKQVDKDNIISGRHNYMELSIPKKKLEESGFNSGRKLMGVCLHPRFGGWFAFRSVIIFSGVIADQRWSQQHPLDLLPDLKDKIDLLITFNSDWKSGKYRDFISVQEKYSALQEQYFNAKPGIDRISILRNHLLETAPPAPLPQIVRKEENEKIL
jgi:methylmalonic aciduria homocystinuria type C protein